MRGRRRAVDEVPGAKGPLLAVDQQQALACEDEEALLARLRVKGVSRSLEEASAPEGVVRLPRGFSHVDDEPAVGDRHKAGARLFERSLLDHVLYSAHMDEIALRELLGEPADVVRAKVSDRLNSLTRQFVDRSPFVLLATSAPDGLCDVSPRGDPPGFVRVLDERTLLLPERPGNRLADSLRNILVNPNVGLLFVIPAFLRSHLWAPERFVDRSELPSAGEIHRSLDPSFDAEAYDAARVERYARRESFY